MKKFEAKTFNIPTLTGISTASIDEHMKLYRGYVTNLNTINEITQNKSIPEYALREVFRRQAFEYSGMRNHEIYFNSLEHGPQSLETTSPLYKRLMTEYGTFETCIDTLQELALTRGIGWAMLGHDTTNDTIVHYWVDEQHLGHLPGVQPILALDMWEHSFVADYTPSGKKAYIEDFFRNINWEIIAGNFAKSAKYIA